MNNKRKNKKMVYQEVNEGVQFYNTIGGVFVFCGIGSLLLLGFVSLLPQNYEKYNIPLFFGIWFAISLVLLIIGTLPLLLGRYSKKYQIWVKKEVNSYKGHEEARILKQGEKLAKKQERK